MGALNVLPDGRIDTKGAATYTGYTVKTLAMWRSQGKGPPFVKRGRVWYFIADLDAWLREGASRGATSAAEAKRERRSAKCDARTTASGA
ncbi:helix-turn-helix domain-containing protein [Paraburkholderia sp. CNPSo 3281]|uniref:helix-turn-helix domain-containing protein n=1 Tax=Paraburkholderia sp. CNPSo 3281 TaxID=2940933 RepID=UPI0020B8845B|nr:helix-turn-helix domain-containing protein [Paraburkholderia sp. CNPSo 3281]MCP3719125.1 helix-turn-helix domain-containing protein [Paraburkholderia sp. CNPSo 3281]